MDILRTALIIGLLALLGAILYKRLLSFMGADKARKRYVSFRGQALVLNGRDIRVELVMPQKEEVQLIAVNTDGQTVQKLLDRALEAGEHSLEFTLDELPAGRYGLILKSAGQESTRYFTI